MNPEIQKYDLSWMVSVDDHVIEPPNVWMDRLPTKYHGVGPRVISTHEGEFWAYEDLRVETGGLGAASGRRPEDVTVAGFPFSEMRPGCYDAKSRLADMDEARILASLNFPSFPRFCGQTFLEAQDKELALLCVQAYNDWMVDEWCATDPGRFIPLGMIPLWDPKLAVTELGRIHNMGVRSFMFTENPAPLGLPSIHSGHWDPVFRAADEMGMVLSIHIGSSSTNYQVSEDSPVMANLALGHIRPAGCMLDWIFGGLFQRFTNLKIALSEGSIGWIPYVLERAEQVHSIQRHWVAEGLTLGNISPVSGTDSRVDHEAINVYQDYREHFFGCFIDDAAGLALLDVVGEDNVMVESDYPHSDSTWPNSHSLTIERLNAANIGPPIQYKILRGNAERLYQFTPAELQVPS